MTVGMKRADTPTARRSSIRHGVGFILSFLLAMGTAVLTMAPAHADSEVRIDNVRFDSDTVEDGSRQSLYVDWSIPARATPSVTLSVDFPEGMVGYPDTFQMMGPSGPAGTCNVYEDRIECSVNDSFITANPYGVSGSFYFDIHTELHNADATDHTFQFGDVEVPVTVEPNPDICEETCEFAGYRFKKYGTYNSMDDTITWTVRLPAPEDGIPAGTDVVVEDDLDEDIFEMVSDYDGETWPQVWEGRCLRIDSEGYEVPRWVDYNNVTWTNNDTRVSFQTRGGNMAGSCVTPTTGSFYLVKWVVKVKDLGRAGTYSNSASYSMNNEDPTSTTGSATRRSGGGDVVGTDFGRFQVTKELDWDGSGTFGSEAPEFTVNYRTFNGATQTDAGTFQIKPGQSYLSREFFRGTRVELDEVFPTEPDNVEWGTPVFLDADNNPVTEITFSEANGNLGENTAQIRLVNTPTLKTNTFTLRKVVENPDGLDLPDDPYRIAWSRDAHLDRGLPNFMGGSWLVPADGSTITSEPMPAGIPYYLGEAEPPEVEGGIWDAPVITVNGKVVESVDDPVYLGFDESVEVVVTNRITADPDATDGDSADGDNKTGALPDAGLSSAQQAGLIAGMGLIMSGAALVLAGRRRNA